MDEYRKRHPSSVGVKNGKSHGIQVESGHERNPGAQPGHEGHSRPKAKITERITVKASQFTCPECSSRLVRTGIRKRIVEDIPPVMPEVVQYRIERMYCRKCGKIYEPDIGDALPNERFSIRAMLVTSFFKHAMRMSLENTSSTMMEVSEGEVQNIMYRISDAPGQMSMKKVLLSTLA